LTWDRFAAKPRRRLAKAAACGDRGGSVVYLDLARASIRGWTSSRAARRLTAGGVELAHEKSGSWATAEESEDCSEPIVPTSVQVGDQRGDLRDAVEGVHQRGPSTTRPQVGLV